MTRTLFFDAVGTLIHLRESVGANYARIVANHGLQLPAEPLEAAFRSHFRSMQPRPAHNGPRPDDDCGWWRLLVDRVLDDCLEPGAVLDRDACFEEMYSRFADPALWTLYPEVEQVLEILGNRCRMAILSNFDQRLLPILEGLGVAKRFERVFVSSQVGADKPDPHIFQVALSEMGIAAAEALHIGDEPISDWEGAAAVGIPVFRLDRPKNSLADLLSGL